MSWSSYCMHELYAQSPNIGKNNDWSCLWETNGLTGTAVLVCISFMQMLFLDSNKIQNMDSRALRGLQNLTVLDVSKNLLKEAPSLMFIGKTLLRLNLDMNHISRIQPNYFTHCGNLEVISLSFNKLTWIPELKFVSQNLLLVEFGANMIDDVTNIYGLYFPKLERLDLSGNNITKFCLPSFRYTPRLTGLALSGNSMTSISLPYERGRYHRGLSISLRQNPWHCDSSMKWFSRCSDERDSILQRVTCPNHMTFKDVNCQSPPQMMGHLAWDVGELYIRSHWPDLTSVTQVSIKTLLQYWDIVWHTCQVTLDISGYPTDFQWGSRKYPG